MAKANQLKHHPAADIFPMLDASAYQRLKDDISAHGQRDEIVYFDGKILDGRNRDKACRELGIEPDTCELEQCDDPVGYVLSKNLFRRHLTKPERVMCAARSLIASRKAAGGVQNCTLKAADIATKFGASRRALFEALKVINKGCRELHRLCETNITNVFVAAEYVELRTTLEVRPYVHAVQLLSGNPIRAAEAMNATQAQRELNATAARLAELHAERCRLEAQRDRLVMELADNVGCHDRRPLAGVAKG